MPPATALPALLTEVALAPLREPGPYRRADYQQLPDEPRCELIYGRFYVSPSPSTRHQVLVAQLWRSLAAAAEATGGLALVAPLDVTLDEHTVVQPDVIYVSADRRSIVGERVEGAPDLLVEVLSPGSARRDRNDKLRLYAQAGVREYWLVDPRDRLVEFLVLREGQFAVLPTTGPVYHSPTLPAVRLDLEELWQALERALPGA